MDARNTRSEGNVSFGYYALSGSTIDATDYTVLASATFSPTPDCGGANTITTDNTTTEPGTKLILRRGSTLMIATDAITVTHSFHSIDTEGAAATDNLATINGGADGQVLVLRTLSSGRDVTVKHGTGNIFLSGQADRVLNHYRDKITLIYDSIDAKWSEIAFGDSAT
jgi:hypothetical protein